MNSTENPVACELVSVCSKNGLTLDGLLFRSHGNRKTVIHIHGSFGNFYQNEFVKTMAKIYPVLGLNFLAINLSTHDGVAEGYKFGGEFEYVGGAVSDFGNCVDDIEGALSFSQQFSERTILQGHSLGCDRVLHFLTSRGENQEFILLSPCDSYKLQSGWIAPETVEEQIRRLKSQHLSDPYFDWLPSREYGVNGGGGWTYPIPITRRAFLSIAEGPPFRLMRIDKPSDFQLGQRACIYVGGKDPLQVWPHEAMFRHLKDRIPRAEQLYVPRGDHMLRGCQNEVIHAIANWAFADENS